MSYPDSFGQYYQSTMSSIDPVKRTGGWETTRSPGKAPAPPSNYHNYHNSLYDSNTPEQVQQGGDENSEIEYYYDDANNHFGNTVGPKPVNGEQFPSYSVHKATEETSQYPDYYDDTASVTAANNSSKTAANKSSKTVYRQKIGKYPR